MVSAVSRRHLSTIAAAALIPVSAARAQPPRLLNVATGANFNSLDPHFQNLSPNNIIADHLFSKLVALDAAYRPVPDLALSWQAVDDHTWEFKLRDGVVFSDGTPFTPDDVVFTFERIPQVLNSPSSFNQAVKSIKRIEVVDKQTIRMVTTNPEPLLPIYMAQPRIVSRRHGQGAGTADYNSGKAAIGTGPFILNSVSLGNKLVLRRNERFYGPAPAWDTVNWQVTPNNSARTAALQSGDVDIIDQVSTHDVAALQRDARLVVTPSAGQRLMYVILDTQRDTTPFAFDMAGKPLATNPLRDVRVRRALSLAVNRAGIRTQIMDGQAVPTGQLMPEGAIGYDPTLPVPAYDPAASRKLLADAGYGSGFQLTVQGPNDRYPNDRAILEAIAQMWTRVGVKTTVDAKPMAMFASETGRDLYTASLSGWASDTGEASSSLIQILASPDPAKGRGATLRASHFADPAIDAVIEESLATFDAGAREALYRKATEMGMAAQACIPLFHLVNIVASRKEYRPRPRQQEGIRSWEVDYTPAR